VAYVRATDQAVRVKRSSTHHYKNHSCQRSICADQWAVLLPKRL
jgi:hypothetical protein